MHTLGCKRKFHKHVAKMIWENPSTWEKTTKTCDFRNKAFVNLRSPGLLLAVWEDEHYFPCLAGSVCIGWGLWYGGECTIAAIDQLTGNLQCTGRLECGKPSLPTQPSPDVENCSKHISNCLPLSHMHKGNKSVPSQRLFAFFFLFAPFIEACVPARELFFFYFAPPPPYFFSKGIRTLLRKNTLTVPHPHPST